MIQSVPAQIGRRKLCALFEAIGIDARAVPREAVLELGRDNVAIEVYALDDDGRPFIGPDGLTPARHRVTIPIVDD